jgi:hypothetical protein
MNEVVSAILRLKTGGKSCILPLMDHQPSAISHQPSAISYQPSAISYRPSAIDHQPSAMKASHRPGGGL